MSRSPHGHSTRSRSRSSVVGVTTRSGFTYSEVVERQVEMIYGGSWEVMGEQLPTIRHAPRLDRQPPPPAPGGKTPLIDLNISSSHMFT